uniref:Uncharacterized protein n=1 Tax=Anguilla anguilla TaxID=7936 RepID=A0A0E9XNZ1_ANGAN
MGLVCTWMGDADGKYGQILLLAILWSSQMPLFKRVGVLTLVSLSNAHET